MTIELGIPIEEELRRQARAVGKPVEALVTEAIRQYLDGAAITDVGADEIAATQTSLFGELTGAPAWDDGMEPRSDETR